MSFSRKANTAIAALRQEIESAITKPAANAVHVSTPALPHQATPSQSPSQAQPDMTARVSQPEAASTPTVGTQSANRPAAVLPEAPHHLLTTEGARPTTPRVQNNAAMWCWIGRVVLWLATGLFGLGELGAIGVTATDGWPTHTVANAVIGNLCFAIPLAGLLWLVVLDFRRLRRRSNVRPTQPDPNLHPKGQPSPSGFTGG